MPGDMSLDEKLSYLDTLLEDVKTAEQDARLVLQQLRRERKENERLLDKKTLRETIDKAVENAIDIWRQRILTEVETARIGEEIDRLIDVALGKEFSESRGREDLRPALAALFGQWIRDLILIEEEKR